LELEEWQLVQGPDPQKEVLEPIQFLIQLYQPVVGVLVVGAVLAHLVELLMQEVLEEERASLICLIHQQDLVEQEILLMSILIKDFLEGVLKLQVKVLQVVEVEQLLREAMVMERHQTQLE
jgi:hypothetical protein|tara:strand:+ start:39 stop:401 length:363 start_codon:yes stop_codon:yes gene_type:complete